MLTHGWKYVKHVFMIFAMLLLLTGVMGIIPSPVQATPVVDAPLSEGMKPSLTEQAASVLVESLSAGNYHTCVVRRDGTVACWGAGTTNTGVLPEYGQSIPPAGNFTQIDAGGYHTCGLHSDGTLACWGAGTTNTGTSPDYGQSIPPAGTFTQVSAGFYHTCGLKSDGTLICWGRNDHSQATPPAGTFRQVSAGNYHTCGLKSDGTLACWGAGTTNTGISPDYGQSIPPAGTFTQISSGGYHTCGLQSNGTLVCWGAGITNTGTSPNFGQSIQPAGTFTHVNAGYYHTCAQKSDGTLSCWGAGTSNTGVYPNYGQAMPPAGIFTQVSGGLDHTCGLKSDGTLTCWGLNNYGQSNPPTGALFGRTQVSAGKDHTCGLKNDGILTCWGNNNYGQSSPVPVGTFTQVSAGFFHNCGLKSDGTLACWGDNGYGQLDNIPTSTFTQVSAGSEHTCGLKSDGTLACWGSNGNGQTNSPSGTFTQVSAGEYHTCGEKSDGTLACWGAGTTNTGIGPEYGQSIPPAGTFIEVSAGGFHTCGIKSDGTLACWGDNSAGQLNNIPTGTFTQVSAGEYHTCGLQSNGTLACWGHNNYGQSTPPAGTFTQVSAGGYHTCGLKGDGTLACWGDNLYGESNTLGISGNVGLAGASLNFTDGSARTAISSTDGSYSFNVSYNWSGSVIPSMTGYTFSPFSRNYTNVQADQTGQDYTATAITYIISGNTGVGEATLSYTDGSPKTASSALDGSYSFNVSYNWSGTVTPSKPGYTFSPVNRSYTNILADQTSQNFVAILTNFTISGNAGDAGVTLSYTDGTPKTVTSALDGSYSLIISYDWSGTVTPSKLGDTFSPVNRSYTNVLADQTGQNYLATRIITISGNVGVAGATLSYTDGTPKTTTSASDGSYSFNVSYGWSGTVTPSKIGYTFTPANRTYNNIFANQPSQDYTATPVATFADVPTNYWAWNWIERLYHAGITGGCGTSPLIYCPDNSVTRAQMAIFLERGMNGSTYTPPAGTGTVFGDVPISYWAVSWIEKLSADGITGGCGGGNYCPANPVTRAQMAIFLLRAEHGSSYAPPAATGTVFGDVPISYWDAAWIEKLSAEGITGGCGGGNYCPASPVTRAQMAIFLVRTFSLP